MSGIYGALGLNETDRAFVSTVGQQAVFDAVQMLLQRWNEDLNIALNLFVERHTSDYKLRYKLPGGGYLQRRGRQGRPAVVKATGYWDVAFPLDDFGAGLGGDDVSLAYMSIQELNRHLDTIFMQDLNTVRFEILKALFDSASFTWADEQWGNLSCVPLANGDSVVYPPVLGADAEATHSHFYGTNYLSSAISDSNNPFPGIRDHLEEHFGTPTGGSQIVAFINQAQTLKVQALTNFVDVPDTHEQPGANTAVAIGLPAGMPGRVLGHTDGCWVVEWRYMPANYIVGLHLAAPKPLIMREDMPESGLGSGLQLIATIKDNPLQESFYRHRFGLAVGNRLNGVCGYFVASTSYTTPTGYAH